jgi:membrane-bound ClpP family serine protease
LVFHDFRAANVKNAGKTPYSKAQPIPIVVFLVEVSMNRCIDLIGIAGFVILVISTLFLFPPSAEKMTWAYWLAGLVLWFMAFIFLVGWLILRWSVPQSRKGPPPLLVWSAGQRKNKEVRSTANATVQRKAA